MLRLGMDGGACAHCSGDAVLQPRDAWHALYAQAATLSFNHTTVLFCEKLFDAGDGGVAWLAKLRAAALRVRSRTLTDVYPYPNL